MSKYNTIGFCTEGSSNIGEIVHKKCVQQDIPIYENHLCGISLKFATFARNNTSKLAVSIIDKANKRVLFSKTIECSTLKDMEWLDLYFPAVEGVTEATLVITPLDSRHGNTVSLLFNPAFTNSKIKIWNHSLRGSLLIKMHHKNYGSRLSICCITYNHAKFIKNALDGFVSQKTDFNFQVLINDDGSTDGTAEIIREYELQYPEIIKAYYNQLNVGAEESFINVLSRAKTEYVAMCDGDDYWTDHEKLQKQVDLLDLNSELSACFHPVSVHDSEGKNADYTFPNKNTHPILYKKGYLELEDLVAQNYIQTNSVVYRWNYVNSDIREYFPDDILPGDWYLHLLHAEQGKIGYISQIMGTYRRHSGGIWSGGIDAVIKLYGKQHANFYKYLNIHFKGKFKDLLEKNEKHLLKRYEDLNKSKKTISVIIPTYNHEEYIDSCINSVLIQKGAFNLEIIVGEDNSSDKTAILLKKYKNIKVISHNQNLGLYENLIKCLENCTGDYVAICEGDDYWTSRWRLQGMLKFMDNNQDCSFCFNHILIEKDNNFEEHFHQSLLSNGDKLTFENFLKCNYPGNFSCCFYRRELLQKTLIEIKSCSDYKVNTVLTKYGKAGFIKQKTSVWRYHDNGSWNGLPMSEKIKLSKKIRMEIIELVNKGKYS